MTPIFEESADRAAIEQLRIAFTDAAMMNDHDRLGSLFTADGALRIPHGGIEAIGPAEVTALGVRRAEATACFIQTATPGALTVSEDTAVGRTYIHEIFQLRDGSSHMNYAVYHDRYQRTTDGWKFTERVYDVRYVDNSVLNGSAPTNDLATSTGRTTR